MEAKIKPYIFVLQLKLDMSLTPLEKVALEAEYNLIVDTLKQTNFSKAKAAILLDIDRKTLYNKLSLYKKAFANKGKKNTISK